MIEGYDQRMTKEFHPRLDEKSCNRTILNAGCGALHIGVTSWEGGERFKFMCMLHGLFSVIRV